MSIEVTIIWDGCSIVGPEGTSEFKSHKIRRSLSTMGWVVGVRGGRDYCSDCSSKLVVDSNSGITWRTL